MKFRNELEREREERNFFQIERDKLRTFWEITRKQYEDSQGKKKEKKSEKSLKRFIYIRNHPQQGARGGSGAGDG